MQPRLRILVVSEGEKTEGIYLSLFIRQLRAANVQIDIMGRECGSDPQTVIEFARAKFQEDKGYDVCFCVIDRDNHALNRFNTALSLAKSIDGKSSSREFICIVSNPCIEYWFLLHFTYTRSPFSPSGQKSAADCVIDNLKKYLPNYEKTCRESLESLLPLTSKALDNAEKVMKDVDKTGEPNPSTSMHDLVERLIKESSLKN